MTICAHNRECLFGQVVGANGIRPEMQLNQYGDIVVDEWMRSAGIRQEIGCGEWVVMPNHFHGIVVISMNRRDIRAYGHTPLRHTLLRRSPSRPVGAMVRGFKSAVTKRINDIRGTPGAPVWQRNYHEHIIRNEADYTRIAEYIADNPRRWAEDSLHPDNFVVGAYGHTPLRSVPRMFDGNE